MASTLGLLRVSVLEETKIGVLPGLPPLGNLGIGTEGEVVESSSPVVSSFCSCSFDFCLKRFS